MLNTGSLVWTIVPFDAVYIDSPVLPPVPELKSYNTGFDQSKVLFGLSVEELINDLVCENECIKMCVMIGKCELNVDFIKSVRF